MTPTVDSQSEPPYGSQDKFATESSLSLKTSGQGVGKVTSADSRKAAMGVAEREPL